MKRGECAKTAQLVVKRLKALLGLDRWEVDIVVGPCSDDAAMAEVSVLAEYLRCNLVIDERRIQDERHLVTVLGHEMLHVTTFPFEAYSCTLAAALVEDAAMLRVLATTHVQAIERVVTGLEPLLLIAYEATYGEIE